MRYFLVISLCRRAFSLALFIDDLDKQSLDQLKQTIMCVCVRARTRVRVCVRSFARACVPACLRTSLSFSINKSFFVMLTDIFELWYTDILAHINLFPFPKQRILQDVKVTTIEEVEQLIFLQISPICKLQNIRGTSINASLLSIRGKQPWISFPKCFHFHKHFLFLSRQF